ncbi:MAG: hypothetical protein P8I39_08740 [Akkermansiaceae bacterium]|nr:hypothetical protein [Akkermansiaceae bacterium]
MLEAVFVSLEVGLMLMSPFGKEGSSSIAIVFAADRDGDSAARKTTHDTERP